MEQRTNLFTLDPLTTFHHLFGKTNLFSIRCRKLESLAGQVRTLPVIRDVPNVDTVGRPGLRLFQSASDAGSNIQ